MNNQVNQDAEHLRILSICHYVLAGLCVFPLLYGLFYMLMGIFFGVAIANAPKSSDGPPPMLFGGIFVFIGLIIALCALGFGISLYKAGRNLSSHQNHTFCFVIAIISCFFMPFGTILGVFTLVVLMRESVKSMFGGQNQQRFGNTPPNWQ